MHLSGHRLAPLSYSRREPYPTGCLEPEALDELDSRDLRGVELAHRSRPRSSSSSDTARSRGLAWRRLYPRVSGFELFETLGAIAQETRGPAPVAVLQMIEADADLEDTLV